MLLHIEDMWILQPTAGQGDSYYLLPGREYIVGRKNCAILLQSDQSISRVHAQISVAAAATSLAHPDLTLKDSSKYGTFVNDEKLANGVEKVLKPEDRVTFGVFNSKFRLEYEPLVVCSSCVDNEGKAILSQMLQQLGGQLVNNWTRDCTHLVMPVLKVTIKTICSLLCCRPIVKPEFFLEFSKAVQQKHTLPKAESFYPDIDEPTLDKMEVDLSSRPERRKLFWGKTFIFLNVKQARCEIFVKRLHKTGQLVGCRNLEASIYGEVNNKSDYMKVLEQKRLTQAVSFGGGQSQLLQEGSLPAALLQSAQTCVIEVTSANSQLPQSASCRKWSDSVFQIVQRKGLRLIAESEIGLAAIYVSTDVYCNAAAKMQSEAVAAKPPIPSATLSQNAAVDETVLPAASQNITAYAPDTEPSEYPSRMDTSGMSAVAETPEKEQKQHTLIDAQVIVETAMSPLNSRTAASQLSGPSGDAQPIFRQQSGMPSSKKQSSPQKQSNLTHYFHPVNKKRMREGCDSAEQSQAKLSRRDEGETLQRDTRTPQTADTGSQSQSDNSSGQTAHKYQGLTKNAAAELRDSSSTSHKRKETVMGNGGQDVDLDDLESIMSLPMEELEEQGASCKRQRVEPEPDLKQEEVSFVVQCDRVNQDVHCMFSKNASTPPKPEESKLAVKKENNDELPKNVLVVEFRSLLVGQPPSITAHSRKSQKGSGKNFKCFKKVPVPGTKGLPSIIGGSDLVAHNRTKNSELEEWMREAAEEESRNEREEALGDDLFRYNPKPSKRR